jgi:hypothetical protein
MNAIPSIEEHPNAVGAADADFGDTVSLALDR